MPWILEIWSKSDIDPKEFVYSFKIAEKVVEREYEEFKKQDGLEKLKEVQNQQIR